jgi:hypothetical protein
MRKANKKTTTKATNELQLIKTLNSYNGKKVTTNQLKLSAAKAKKLLENKACKHRSLIRLIDNKITESVAKLTKQNIEAVNSLQLSEHFFSKLEKPIHKPKVTSVTLGKIQKEKEANKSASKKKDLRIGISKVF